MVGSETTTPHEASFGLSKARVAGGWLAILGLLTVGVLNGGTPTRASAGADTEEPGVLFLPVATPEGQPVSELRKGRGAAWKDIPESQVMLSRTPPLYEGDPPDEGVRPITRVALVRTGSSVLLRIRWADPSPTAPAEPTRRPDVGDPSIYMTHSSDLATFADAVCVMVSRRRGRHDSYPPLMMGGRGEPVDLFYWSLESGFDRLDAHGRATTEPTGQPCEGSSQRSEGGWSVVFELPGVEPHTPVAFAVWDGAREHRDGLKYFTPWYEVGG